MLTLLLALVSGAHAQDLQPGVALPGAASMDGTKVYIGAGGVCDTGYGCGPMAQGQASITDRLGLVGEVPFFVTATEDNPIAAGSGGVRFELFDEDLWRVAPIGVVGTQDMIVGDDDSSFVVGLGLAGELGGDALPADLTLDAAMPALIVADEDLDWLGRTFGASELGLSATIGEDWFGTTDTNRVRVGASRLDPYVSYRIEGEQWWGEAQAVWSTNDGDLGAAGTVGAIF